MKTEKQESFLTYDDLYGTKGENVQRIAKHLPLFCWHLVNGYWYFIIKQWYPLRKVTKEERKSLFYKDTTVDKQHQRLIDNSSIIQKGQNWNDLNCKYICIRYWESSYVEYNKYYAEIDILPVITEKCFVIEDYEEIKNFRKFIEDNGRVLSYDEFETYIKSLKTSYEI